MNISPQNISPQLKLRWAGKTVGYQGLLLFCLNLSIANAATSMTAAGKSALAESALANYDGVLGSAPEDVTITASGFALQDTPSSAQGYLFFSQTLKNQFYYEARLWGAYNYMSQNPIFPSVQASTVQNPPGYGSTGIFGYNFHATTLLDITPYLQMNYFKNMVLVYADSTGNYINSTAIAGFVGTKLIFKVNKVFTPFFNFWGGFQQVALIGNLTQGSSANETQTATVDQIVVNTQIGLDFKISAHISLAPYLQYQTTANYPDSVAMASPQNGGFGVSSTTTSQQIIGMKFNAFW